MNLQNLKDGEKVINTNKMNKFPQIEVIYFDSEDIITTSGGNDWKKDTELDEV